MDLCASFRRYLYYYIPKKKKKYSIEMFDDIKKSHFDRDMKYFALILRYLFVWKKKLSAKIIISENDNIR